MSVGGDGVVKSDVSIEVARMSGKSLGFVPRRFKAGGRLNIADDPEIEGTVLITCVLCGGLILDEEKNLEHPLPQWLHRFAGDVGNVNAMSFDAPRGVVPTWRQLCLSSHQSCNSTFAKVIENPAISSLKTIVKGGVVSSNQIDALFDWLDKVKSSSAHMATALLGHALRLDYNLQSFPNLRIGLFDRFAIFFKVSDFSSPLDLWNCLNEAFLTTPASIALRVKDLVIVYVSGNFLLSRAFGLGTGVVRDSVESYAFGDGKFASGFGTRLCRIPTAKIIAQPMRRQHRLQGLIDESKALHDDGVGKIFELENNRWSKRKSYNFSNLPTIMGPIGDTLASLETVEWIILTKEQDAKRYTEPDKIFLRSVPWLLDEKNTLEPFAIIPQHNRRA